MAAKFSLITEMCVENCHIFGYRWSVSLEISGSDSYDTSLQRHSSLDPKVINNTCNIAADIADIT